VLEYVWKFWRVISIVTVALYVKLYALGTVLQSVWNFWRAASMVSVALPMLYSFFGGVDPGLMNI
jgi:cation transporter-like permease